MRYTFNQICFEANFPSLRRVNLLTTCVMKLSFQHETVERRIKKANKFTEARTKLEQKYTGNNGHVSIFAENVIRSRVEIAFVFIN